MQRYYILLKPGTKHKEKRKGTSKKNNDVEGKNDVAKV